IKLSIFPLLVLILLFSFTSISAKAQVAITNVEINPQTLLIGDVAECKLVIYNPNSQSVKISSVQFDVPSGLSIKPSFVNVGYIAKQSNYELPFYIEAKKPGRYTVEARIFAENGSITQRINVLVEDRMPKIIMNSPIKLNEVNTVDIEITTPLEINSVTIEPLFDAEQKYIFIDQITYSAKKSIKFYGKKQEYKFKISFYNGKNYHSLIQEVQPRFVESKGLFINITLSYASVYLYDIIPITVEVSNLREDDVYEIAVSTNTTKGEFSEYREKIPKLGSLESKTIVFYYLPMENGSDKIYFKITYKDEMNYAYNLSEFKTLKILNQPSLAISNVEVEMENGITITGDVSNNGRSEALNVYVSVDFGDYSKDYFVGNIDPSDFQSFSIPLLGNDSKAVIKARWTNEIGKNFEIVKEVKLNQAKSIKPAEFPMWISVIAVVVVGVFVAVAIYNYKKRR
ncbi:hypothetical protein DRO97_03605, partial [Archaeoglobales archaeon]